MLLKCNIFRPFSPPSAFRRESHVPHSLVTLALGLATALPAPGTAQRSSRTATGRVQRAARASAPAAITIPYQRFVLKNGLTLLVHEDHKAPIVAVNIWYHVGLQERAARAARVRAPVRST